MVELGHFISSSCTISAVGNRFHEVELGPLLFVSRSEIYIFYSLFYCYFDNTMHNFRCFRCQNIRYEVLFFLSYTNETQDGSMSPWLETQPPYSTASVKLFSCSTCESTCIFTLGCFFHYKQEALQCTGHAIPRDYFEIWDPHFNFTCTTFEPMPVNFG